MREYFCVCVFLPQTSLLRFQNFQLRIVTIKLKLVKNNLILIKKTMSLLKLIKYVCLITFVQVANKLKIAITIDINFFDITTTKLLNKLPVSKSLLK